MKKSYVYFLCSCLLKCYVEYVKFVFQGVYAVIKDKIVTTLKKCGYNPSPYPFGTCLPE